MEDSQANMKYKLQPFLRRKSFIFKHMFHPIPFDFADKYKTTKQKLA